MTKLFCFGKYFLFFTNKINPNKLLDFFPHKCYINSIKLNKITCFVRLFYDD